MNFLSHYYINRENNSPEYTLGKILPDLLRIAGIRKKFKPNRPAPNLGQSQLQLMSGLHNHLLVDKYWHGSHYFEQYSGKLKQALKAQDFTTIDKYYYFHAHILLELMLDRLLIKHDPTIPQLFYRQLRQIKEETIRHFFRYNGLPGDGGDFYRFFDRFRASEYLYNYTDNEKLMYALGRINERAGVPTFSADDQQPMYEVIDEAERILKDGYLSIFKWIHTKLRE